MCLYKCEIVNTTPLYYITTEKKFEEMQKRTENDPYVKVIPIFKGQIFLTNAALKEYLQDCINYLEDENE